MILSELESGHRPKEASLPIRCAQPVRLRFVLTCALLSLWACQTSRAQTPEEIKEQVGFTALKALLGESIAYGVGVPIADVAPSIVAPPNPPVYHPNPTYSQFLSSSGDPFSQDVTFIDPLGGLSNGTAGHATTNVGQYYYGNTFSFTPGANTVTIYEVNDWLDNVLNVGGGAPANHDVRVENYSWIGTGTSSSSFQAETLGRFDYLIDNNNLTAVVGTNSGGTPSILMTHSLNAIAVGVTPGTNPTLPTVTVNSDYDYPGRNKPDIVAPGGGSSSATAGVSSAATLLHDAGTGSNSTMSETIKAILLAGATKDEFPSWSHSPTQPLDSQFGAGELNVYNSYAIQAGALQPDPGTPGDYLPDSNFPGSTTQPASPAGIDGWDYNTSANGTPLYYDLEIPVGSSATELSVVLTWNSEVGDSSPGPSFTPDVSLDNLDLRLYDSSATFLGTEIDYSTSTVNNVEHIHMLSLGPGTYTLEVSNLTASGSRDFGLAWRLETLFDEPSADFDQNGFVDGMDYLTWQRSFGMLTGATLSDGDADGDGDVDEDDRMIYENNIGPVLGPLAAVLHVPEPGTLSLGAIGLFLLYLSRRVRLKHLLADA